MRFAALTTVGNVRHENQDSVVVGRTLCAGAERVLIEGDLAATPGGTLAAVVDGMGGHRGGREASATVGRYLLNRGRMHLDVVRPGESQPAAFDESAHTQAAHEMLTAANCLLYDEMARRPELEAMGATIAGLACLPEATVLFSIGDARSYQYVDGYLQRMSEDHRGPTGSLLQSLGGTAERVGLAPFVQTVERVTGGRWLLCSDGLWDFVPFLALQDLLGQPDLTMVVRDLVAAALDAGSTDNVSVVVVDDAAP
jgi:serine/threonine protein phosphatase PrpC